MKKKVLVAVSYLLILALGVMGTVAYFTDREAEVNVFTVGDVQIELNNSFDQGAELMPGKTIDNEVSITNTGKNDAWVWFNLGVDAKVLKALKIDFADTNWGVANAEGAYLYPAVIPAGATVDVLTSITMWANVDATPDGDLYFVNAGKTEALGWNVKANGYPTIDLAAYAIQADQFANVDIAYAAYNTQWGDKGVESGSVTSGEVADDAALKDALTSDSKVIVVELTEDVTYDVTAWQGNAMGGQATEEIVILGNGHTIAFNNINSDWNNIVTNGAKLTIKDAVLTNSGYNATSGTWNGHDITFNCPVELTDVECLNAIAVEDDATFTNVKITDDSTGDAYMLWIAPHGQTVTLKNCEIDATGTNGNDRGIKIDEQYVGAPEKVTLNVSDTTFKTEKKAAILVKSSVGAEINVSNVDISGVAEDPINAVWVDEDSAAYADLVTVNGASKIVEGNFKIVKVGTNEEFAKALNDSKTDAVVLAKNATGYEMPISVNLQTKTLTIIGEKGTVIDVSKVDERNQFVTGATLKFEGVTLNFGTKLYMGFANCASLTYKNCVINGSQHLYGPKVTFEGCTLNIAGDEYMVRTWGGKNVTFNGCTFNCDGKAILVYNQSCNLTVNNCVFNDNGTISGKAAIEACNGDNGANCVTHNIVVNNTKVNGFDVNPNGTNTGSTLWGNKNSLDDAHLNVTVDGVVVY